MFNVTLKDSNRINLWRRNGCKKLTGVALQGSLKLGYISTAYYQESPGHCCYMSSYFHHCITGERWRAIYTTTDVAKIWLERPDLWVADQSWSGRRLAWAKVYDIRKTQNNLVTPGNITDITLA